MGKRIHLRQVAQYDISQKVVEALADLESCAILFSTVKGAKTATDIAFELKIPPSTVYKKINELEELTLLTVEKIMRSKRGRNYKLYRSRISRAEIHIQRSGKKLILYPNN